MEYNFRKFQGKNTRQENRITITKSDQLGLPTQFYNENDIKRFKYAILFWDKENKAIGIHFNNEKEEKSSFSVIHSNNYGANVIIRSFLKANNIDPKKYAGRYNWRKQNLEGVGDIYIIELKETTKG